MTSRVRVAVLAGIVVLAILGAVGYVVYAAHERSRQQAAAPPVPTQGDLAGVQSAPHLVFRNTALGSAYGQVAMVALSDPGGPRAVTPASCERVYATSAVQICLAADRGLVTTYRMELWSPQWTRTRQTGLAGLPSRARLSRDGKLSATTTFVYGDSYTNPGQFSTRTLISTVDGKSSADLETFTLLIDGSRVTASDRNFWGVTFAADDDTFYATAATGGKTYLVKGSLAGHRLTSIRTDVECPSLSPDGTRIAFKKHGSLPPGKWRLAVYDLATGKETLLAEEHSVDDQVEWLDNSHVLYGLPRTGSGAATSDIWSVPADGTGTPAVLVKDAWSPAVVR
jgi:hypothetical protein